MDPKELIAALAVLADPNASDADKAAALDKLSAYFNSLLDAGGGDKTAETTTSETGAEEEGKEKPAEKEKLAEKTSETGDDKSGEYSPEMSSALATIATLQARVSKLEKASAIGAAPRLSKPTIIARDAPAEQSKDPVVSMIEAAERNTLRNLSK